MNITYSLKLTQGVGELRPWKIKIATGRYSLVTSLLALTLVLSRLSLSRCNSLVEHLSINTDRNTSCTHIIPSLSLRLVLSLVLTLQHPNNPLEIFQCSLRVPVFLENGGSNVRPSAHEFVDFGADLRCRIGWRRLGRRGLVLILVLS